MIFPEDLRRHSHPVIHFDSYSEMRVTLEHLKREEFSVIEINTIAISGARDFLTELSRCFCFPTVSTNWDSAEDWLRDLSWSNHKGHVLVIRASKLFWSDHYEVAAVLLQVWTTASEVWRHESVPFHLIFCED